VSVFLPCGPQDYAGFLREGACRREIGVPSQNILAPARGGVCQLADVATDVAAASARGHLNFRAREKSAGAETIESAQRCVISAVGRPPNSSIRCGDSTAAEPDRVRRAVVSGFCECWWLAVESHGQLVMITAEPGAGTRVPAVACTAASLSLLPHASLSPAWVHSFPLGPPPSSSFVFPFPLTSSSSAHALARWRKVYVQGDGVAIGVRSFVHTSQRRDLALLDWQRLPHAIL